MMRRGLYKGIAATEEAQVHLAVLVGRAVIVYKEARSVNKPLGVQCCFRPFYLLSCSQVSLS